MYVYDAKGNIMFQKNLQHLYSSCHFLRSTIQQICTERNIYEKDFMETKIQNRIKQTSLNYCVSASYQLDLFNLYCSRCKLHHQPYLKWNVFETECCLESMKEDNQKKGTNSWKREKKIHETFILKKLSWCINIQMMN